MPARESREDLIIIKNIDVDCEELTEELVRRDKTVLDSNGHAIIGFEEVVDGYDHKDFFQVKFDGHPHRIKPGAERILVRYLGEHFAKHLADHILQKKEQEVLKKTNRVVQLMNNAVERPKVLGQIMLGVYQYYYDSEEAVAATIAPGDRLSQRMEEINANRPVPTARERRDAGELAEIQDDDPIENKAMGKLEDTPVPVADQPAPKPTEEQLDAPRDPDRPALDQPGSLTRKELVEAAGGMGITVTNADSKEKIIEKLKQFT